MPLLCGVSALLQMPTFGEVGPGVEGRGLRSVLQWRWCPTDAELCAPLDLVIDPKVTIFFFRREEWA